MEEKEIQTANEEFLLSLSLFKDKLDIKEYMKRLYAISNHIFKNKF